MSRSWYFTETELELDSPSRRDGIEVTKESKLRAEYCSHIQKVSHCLKLDPTAIATAMFLRHRFYARQSHVKNCWHTVASSCILLASKVQDTPRSLGHVVTVVYHHEICERVTRLMAKNRINPNDVRNRDELQTKVTILRREKKELILAAERVVLKTIGFDFDIELPYKPLMAVLKRLTSDKITDLSNMECSLVEEWLKTSLCLQYKPQYIAVGSVVVAARVLNVKLPAGENWLQELGVLPTTLDEVVCWMQSKIGKMEAKQEDFISVSFYEITSKNICT